MLWRIPAGSHSKRIGTMPSFENPTNGPSAFGPAARAAPGDSAGSHVEYHYWQAIDDSLLQEGRGAVPEFPVARLPQPWRDWVVDTARSAGAPAASVAPAPLSAAALEGGVGVAPRHTAFFPLAHAVCGGLFSRPVLGHAAPRS